MSRLRYRAVDADFRKAGATVANDSGARIEHTSVTSGQIALLLSALDASRNLGGVVVEIGSFRGVTTQALARATNRKVVAVDPYHGEGGHKRDYEFFRLHTAALSNVSHLRKTSDEAFQMWDGGPLSVLFIDAIHEYLHAWYDFAAWGSLVVCGGFVAFHDVDRFPGVNRVCQRILFECPQWKPWALAPNLAIFQREE